MRMRDRLGLLGVPLLLAACAVSGPRSDEGCGVAGLLPGVLLVKPSADLRRWNLRALHELAEGLMDKHHRHTHTHADTGVLTLALAIPRRAFRYRDDADHVPKWAVRLREITARAVVRDREGDLVYVSYVGGDPNRPVIVGRLYSDKASPPIHAEGEWRVESPLAGEASLMIDKDQSIVLTAGKNIITIKKDDVIEIAGEADLKIEIKGDVNLKCQNAKIDASGDIDLGEGGGGVITDKTHKCYFTGAPLVGSIKVKAKG